MASSDATDLEPVEPNPSELIQVLKVLKKYNLKDSEEILKRELNKKTPSNLADLIVQGSNLTDHEHLECYESFARFSEMTKEHKHEIDQTLYPLFMHLYLDLIDKDQMNIANDFYEKFAKTVEEQHRADLKQVRLITSKDQLSRSELRKTLCSNKYNVKVCEESLKLIKDFLKMKNSKLLADLLRDNVVFEVYSGPLRNQRQQTMNSGGVLGESNSSNNVQKMFYGIFKEPELNLPEEADEMGADGAEENEKPKKKKNKRDTLMNKKNRVDPNAPPANRVPLPELRDVDRANRQQALKDYMKRARLGPEKLPSICFYTILNSYNTVNCCDISDDSIWLVLGLSDSTVRVCTLSEKIKLKILKPLQELEVLDKESDDILNLMFDEQSGADHRTLIGHSGPVFSVSFSPDKYYVLSGSQDGTIRLWCLLTYSCLVSYKGHNGPIWDVKFGPYGHYFASCGHDKTARVWTTDSPNSVRVYYEHLMDVECVCFHPNCNYLATGSTDRAIRIFDLANLTDNPQVRQFTGHKGVINILKFSNCGRFLASGGEDAAVLIWDLSTSFLVAQFQSHQEAIYSLEFSRDNFVLASGGLDNTVKVWNMNKLVKEVEQAEDMSTFETKSEDQYEIGSWQTKLTPIIKLHFTRRNLLVGIGPFKHN